VPLAPLAPSNFTGTTVATSTTRARVDLKWTDNSNNETSFVIQRSTSPAFTTVTTLTGAANKTTLANTGLARHTTYYYRILARNAYGDSPWAICRLSLDAVAVRSSSGRFFPQMISRET